MKRILFLTAFAISGFFSSSQSHAQDGLQTSTARADELTLDDDTPVWNLNIGYSQFSGGEKSAENLKGNGVAIELQKRVSDMVYLGGSYTYYKTEYTQRDRSSLLPQERMDSVDVLAASVELRPIQAGFGTNSQFFAAVFGGAMAAPFDPAAEFSDSSFFFGAGLGLNIGQKIGLRADVKANRDFASMNSISLIGYY